MESQPLVSIVTPSYNQACFLEQTILSVLGQDYPHLEYLIVDGCSTDSSVNIIQRYSDRLAWWVSEKDNGQADGINKGMRRAKGEIIAWLNSDDYYLPGAVAKSVAVFSARPEVGLIYGNVLAVDEEGSKLNLLHYGDWGLEGLMTFRIIGQPSVFMRRRVLEQTGYLDPSYHLLLDHHLWIRMANLAGMAYVPETWAAARFHGAAKNTARAGEFGQEVFRILDWMQRQSDLAPIWLKNEKRIRAGAYRLSAFYWLDGDQPGAALCDYGLSFLEHPLTVLHEWKRILFAFLSLLGLNRLGNLYRRLRRAWNSFS
jgi:glycosyltransferase involved in cell wall biosynthesis